MSPNISRGTKGAIFMTLHGECLDFCAAKVAFSSAAPGLFSILVGCFAARLVKEGQGSGGVRNNQTAQCNFGGNSLADCYLHWRLGGTAGLLGPPKVNEAKQL